MRIYVWKYSSGREMERIELKEINVIVVNKKKKEA